MVCSSSSGSHRLIRKFSVLSPLAPVLSRIHFKESVSCVLFVYVRSVWRVEKCSRSVQPPDQSTEWPVAYMLLMLFNWHNNRCQNNISTKLLWFFWFPFHATHTYTSLIWYRYRHRDICEINWHLTFGTSSSFICKRGISMVCEWYWYDIECIDKIRSNNCFNTSHTAWKAVYCADCFDISNTDI